MFMTFSSLSMYMYCLYIIPVDGDLAVHEDSQDDEERQKPECGKECAPESDSCQHESIPERDGELSQQELKEESQRGTDEECE